MKLGERSNEMMEERSWEGRRVGGGWEKKKKRKKLCRRAAQVLEATQEPKGTFL